MKTEVEIKEKPASVAVTVIDADRIRAITALAQMGLELAKALAASPRVEFNNCPVEVEVTGKDASAIAIEVKGEIDVDYE